MSLAYKTHTSTLMHIDHINGVTHNSYSSNLANYGSSPCSRIASPVPIKLMAIKLLSLWFPFSRCIWNATWHEYEIFLKMQTARLNSPSIKSILYLAKISKIFQSSTRLVEEKFSFRTLPQILFRFSLILPTKQSNLLVSINWKNT